MIDAKIPYFIYSMMHTCFHFSISEIRMHSGIDDKSVTWQQFFLVAHKIMLCLTMEGILDLMKYGSLLNHTQIIC